MIRYSIKFKRTGCSKKMSPKIIKNEIGTIDHQGVANFLKANPDFFVSQPELLINLSLPKFHGKDTESIVDFQLYQLKQANAEIDQLRNCAQDVIETSRNNMSIQTRTHAAVLALIHVKSVNQLFQVAYDDLPLLLDIDTVAVCFERSQKKIPILDHEHIQKLDLGVVDKIIGASLDAQLYSKFDDEFLIFGPASSLVKSAAVASIRLRANGPPGLIALGSRKQLFHPRQGTDLIVFLARVIQASIIRFMDK